MEVQETNTEPVKTIEINPFKLTKRKITIAGVIFMLGFYCSAKMYSDIILSFLGIDYSYQITDAKSFKLLVMTSIFTTLISLSLALSFVLNDLTSRSKKVIVTTLTTFVLMQVFYQTVFFDDERANEVNKGYRELVKYLQLNSHQDFIKSDIYKQMASDRDAGDEVKLVGYIKEKAALLSIPNTLLTGLISVNSITQKPESKAMFNEIYKDKFVTRRELNDYKKLIAKVESNKKLPDSLNEVITTINVRGQKTVIRQ